MSSRGKSSFKSFLPKLSFKFRNTTSEIEKAAILALGDSLAGTRGKPLIRRTLSLTKLFTPKMKRTSSLPVTPIIHSNPESMHGGNTVEAKNRTQLPIHRSRSVPSLIKEGSIRQIDPLSSVFRVVPTTPRVAEGMLTTSTTAPTNDVGVVVQMEMMMVVKTFPKKQLFVGSAWLNLGRVATPLRWNVAAKASSHWLTKNVL
ncbi:hypothetical protein CsSME_00038378 [Camellia sinensis var. sinensis]